MLHDAEGRLHLRRMTVSIHSERAALMCWGRTRGGSMRLCITGLGRGRF